MVSSNEIPQRQTGKIAHDEGSWIVRVSSGVVVVGGLAPSAVFCLRSVGGIASQATHSMRAMANFNANAQIPITKHEHEYLAQNRNININRPPPPSRRMRMP
jgi:hypothetical protein